MGYGYIRAFFVYMVMFICLVAAFGCTEKKDISGTWKGKLTLPTTGKSLSNIEFSLEHKGNDVTGTMLFKGQGGKLPLAGKVADGKVTLSSPVKNGLGMSFTGTLQEKGKISGEALLNYDTSQLGKRQDKAVLELTR